MTRYVWVVLLASVWLLVLAGCRKAEPPGTVKNGAQPVAAPSQGAPVNAPPQYLEGQQPVETPSGTPAGQVVTAPTDTGGGGGRPLQRYMQSMTPEEREKWNKMSEEERNRKRQEIMSGK